MFGTYSFISNTLEWKLIAHNSPVAPCIRASHSSAVYNGKCYIFGGPDDDNNKLNDFWELDLATETYKAIEVGKDSAQPVARSGHTANIHKGKMYIFGGILELTKELNEMLVYDFAKGKFEVIGDMGEAAAIDGTVNFLHGIPHFAISIALKSNNEIISGLILSCPITLKYFLMK